MMYFPSLFFIPFLFSLVQQSKMSQIKIFPVSSCSSIFTIPKANRPTFMSDIWIFPSHITTDGLNWCELRNYRKQSSSDIHFSMSTESHKSDVQAYGSLWTHDILQWDVGQSFNWTWRQREELHQKSYGLTGAFTCHPVKPYYSWGTSMGVVVPGEVGVLLIYAPILFFKAAHPATDMHPF